MPTKVTLSGFKEFRNKLDNLPADLFQEIGGEVKYAAEYWADLAKRDAPKDQGLLAGNIDAGQVSVMRWDTTSHAEYSAYMEWGTKGRAKVPAELQGYASQFRGKGTGDYYDFLKSILEWVERKGIASRFSVKTKKKLKATKADNERITAAAEAIAFAIMRHGVKPHPYFFIQMPLVEKQLFTNVQNILKTEH